MPSVPEQEVVTVAVEEPEGTRVEESNLYRNRAGYLVNEMNEWVDKYGRLKRDRGAPGKKRPSKQGWWYQRHGGRVQGPD